MDDEEDVLSALVAIAEEEVRKIDQEEKLRNQNDERYNANNQNEGTPAPSMANSTNNLTIKAPKILTETDIFGVECNLSSNLRKSMSKGILSTVHNGDTDSSDDEGNRNYEEQKYNEYGREIKSILNETTDNLSCNSISSSHYGQPKTRISTWKKNPNVGAKGTLTNPGLSKNSTVHAKAMEKPFQDVYMDPIFGMRIVNPKISSAVLVDKMEGRQAVPFSLISRHVLMNNHKDKDWVICGVVVHKSSPKTSQKGSQYSIWTLSDLKDNIKTVAIFMFSGAHSELWKTVVGTVVGVLNPNVLDRKDGSKDEACLSIDTPQKVMIFGQSKDFGICKSTKKNGEKCTAIVNLSKCEFCVYHIKQEYQKCSKRSDLQANFAGKGLVGLRNKVLGKNEVFYAGKSYVAIPAKKSKKLERRDQNIMQNLSGTTTLNNHSKQKKLRKTKTGVARHLDVNPAQRARDIELLKKLGGSVSIETKSNFSGTRSSEVTLEESKTTAISVINKLKARKSDENQVGLKKNNSQFDMRSDLFVSIESKTSFSGNLSESVSLEESKNTALEVISKLKAKKNGSVAENTIEDKKRVEEEMSIEEIEKELEYDDLNYDSINENDYSPNASCSNSLDLTSKNAGSSYKTPTTDLKVASIQGPSSSCDVPVLRLSDDKNSKKSRISLFGSVKPASKNASINGNLNSSSIDSRQSAASTNNSKPISVSPSSSSNMTKSMTECNIFEKNTPATAPSSSKVDILTTPNARKSKSKQHYVQSSTSNTFNSSPNKSPIVLKQSVIPSLPNNSSPRSASLSSSSNVSNSITDLGNLYNHTPSTPTGSEVLNKTENVLTPKTNRSNVLQQNTFKGDLILGSSILTGSSGLNQSAIPSRSNLPSTDSSLNALKPRSSNTLSSSNQPKTSLGLNSTMNSMAMGIPMLPGLTTGSFIDLSKPITSRHVDRAKLNAIKYIQRNGPIKKVNPNSTKGQGAKKRALDDVLREDNEHLGAKKSKLQESEFISDRFKKMMAMNSAHADLLEVHDDEEKEKYFRKLEIKEQMEEKMATTFKVKCKAVRCLKCKYTSFSAAEICKSERHPLKVFDAMKRFFKCSNCQYRTATLDIFPTKPCTNCGSLKWERTGMMKEKTAVVQHALSIRGGEQKFVNSVASDASLDLLVPVDD